MKKIAYDDSRIHYCGRMEKDPECEGYRWVFAASSALIRFQGSSLRVEISVKREGWDFSKWTPQIVVIALGQNDSHPTDFMKDDYNGIMASKWRTRYAWFINQLLSRYPVAKIICTTTIRL